MTTLKKCPYCGQMIPPEAPVCLFCQREAGTPETVKAHQQSERKRKLSFMIFLIVVFGLIALARSLPNRVSKDWANSGSTDSAHQCVVGTYTFGHVLANTGDVPLMNGPGLKTGQVLNEMAPEYGNLPPSYVNLSPSHDLEAICQSGDWLQVKIVAVEGRTKDALGRPLPFKTGWVEQRFISRELTGDQKRGLYWNVANDEHVAPEDKDWVREGALRVLSDNKQCKRIDYGAKFTGLFLGINRTGQYRIACSEGIDDGVDAFDVFFSKEDVVSNKSLAFPTAYDESASRKMCEAAIKSKARFPSTVNVHSFMGYATKTFPGDGRRLIVQDFSAKNAHGLELTYRAECWTKPDGQFKIDIQEKDRQQPSGASSEPPTRQQPSGASSEPPTKPGWVTAPTR
jgi:hypothetical protein